MNLLNHSLITEIEPINLLESSNVLQEVPVLGDAGFLDVVRVVLEGAECAQVELVGHEHFDQPRILDVD